ncbi:basement membrane proteoglycan-like [Astyanax mexicanus]|uniref:Basement membrane proteoglycan-like n=1 Tax=Astyanax mexicanus TaxID=7994 RepID=A0A8T2LS99_ASTMX|nr:basement membrane proteoglycan-like [Astyanax mexicanus]
MSVFLCRQGQNTVPDGVKAEGNTLHFLKWTADVSGTYFCVATNQNGPKVATVYVYIENSDKSVSTWFKKVLRLTV